MGGEAGNEEDAKPRHIELVTDDLKVHANGEKGGESSPVLTNGKGWDGKLRVPGRASLANPEALSDPEYSDEDNVVQGEEIQADEGSQPPARPPSLRETLLLTTDLSPTPSPQIFSMTRTPIRTSSSLSIRAYNLSPTSD